MDCRKRDPEHEARIDTILRKQLAENNEQSDKDFDGPVSKRSCRDVICLIIFLAFWGGMGYIAYVAIRDGQPERLIFGADSYGNVCGSKNKPIDNVTLSGMDMRDRPFLFYFDVSAIVDPTTESKMLCVKKCPEGVIFQSLEDYAIETNITLCDYDVDVEDYGSASTGPVAQCPEWPITNQTVILNRCFPLNFLESVTDTFSTIFNADLLRKIFSDIEKSWHEILYLCAISVGLAVVITIIMRFFAAVIIYITVFVFIIGSLGGTAYLWYLWYSSKTELDNMSTELRMDEDEDNVKTLLIYAGVASGVTRISLVVTLFKEAGKAIASMPFLLIQPVWTFLFVAVLCVYWLFIYLYIATAGQAQLHKDSGFVEYVEDEAVKIARCTE
uniref:Choline transporter-like protein n=1 Tax=Saccoglossus kowalevskii TaxID=10224 RepID=A0ABM0M5Q4_SACKO|nr:PREDICTED: choline transporter-like protein 1-like [Saccoglossus kowalevskii]